MKKVTALCLVISLVFSNVPVAFSDDSDIFGTNVQPNVLILLDTSGSMDDTINTNVPYDPATTYPGSNTSTVVYRKNTFIIFVWYTVYANSISQVNSSSAQTALSTVGFWTGSIGGSNLQLFVGNYLNYLACSSCQGIQKKIDIAKTVINNLINNTDGVRFGVMRFVNNSLTSTGGGGIVAEIGSSKTAIATAVNAIDPSGWTPLGRQMDDAGRYYKGETLRNGSTYASPIQYSCQPSFVIVISDGLWTDALPVVSPVTEATNRNTQDHSTFSGTQNVIVHTVGFSLNPSDSDEKQALQDLQQMATNGGGSFYTANNSAQLEQALQDAVQQIVASTFSFATPVIPTTGTSGSDKAYLAAFQSNPSRPFWRGFLEAYNKDANGLIPVDANGNPLDSALAWDAGQQLSVKPAANRTIYTVISGTKQSFTKSNSALTSTLLGATSTAERDKIIDFARGIDAYDENADGNVTEERAWKLGDIFHSTPVLVAPPFKLSADSTYNDFKTANASRTTVLIAGANDGMIHAFRESDAQELWALIPPDQLDRLKNLTALSGLHGFFVDSSPVAADIKIGSDWKTIVVFGSRRGGRSYHALDITDTTNPGYLWSFTDSKMGETWSEPAIGKIKMAGGTDKFVAFVGGGYDTPENNNSGKAFFVIDLSNGNKLWEYYKPTSATDDRQYMNFSLAVMPSAVDLNGDGYVDRVYIGDIGGQMWKFDVSSPATLSGGLVTNWTGKRLFTASPSQPNPPPAGEYYPAQAIYSQAALAYDTNGGLWLFFGTGDRNHPNNASSNRFYGIKENTNMTNGSSLTESNLTNMTSGSGTVAQGWYIVLNANEKVLSPADVFNNSVLFTTFTPVSTVACGSGGGDAKLYAVSITAGDASVNLANGQALSPGQSALAMAKAVGTGIPSRPIVILNPSGKMGNPFVITGTTNQQISNSAMPPVTMKRLVGWREVF